VVVWDAFKMAHPAVATRFIIIDSIWEDIPESKGR
jgi:hypothetical protein